MTIESIIIIVIIGLQIVAFWQVRSKISTLKYFFPKNNNDIKVKSKWRLQKDGEVVFVDSLEELIEGEKSELEKYEVLDISSITSKNHLHFNEVVESTNHYLTKNIGASADFEILKDICQRQIDRIDNEISNLINVPLYLGLAGTFMGIIIGLSGVDVTVENGGATTMLSSTSITELLEGVVFAMSASLSGLVLTIVNSAVFYKPSIFKIDSDKIFYYDFLQRDLLPFLNLSAAKSLGNFKDVLNHFISRFGENMDEYKDSGELLNDNLQKQQAVLEEINKLSLTRTASKVSEIFADLKSSSEHLERFKEYQQGLNDYIDRSEKVTDNFQQIISNFEDFNLNLKSLGSQIVSSVELQNQLKSSLEIHFPTMKDHREVWRSHVDELNEDIKEVYDGLNDYFESSTERIKKYVNDNDSLFQAIEVIQNSIKSFALSSQAQQEQFKELSSAIVAMRTDFSTAREASDELNKNLLDVVVEMKTQLVKSNIHIIPNGQK